MKATVNGKEIKVVGKDVIQALYTEKVQELISQGMRFSFTDAGHQGEISKCDLTSDGKTIYRVLIDNSSVSTGERFYESIDTVVITIYKYENVNKNSTLWNYKGELIYEKTFFNLGKRSYTHNEAFTEDLEIAKEIKALQDERSHIRWSMRTEWIKLPESWNRKVLPVVRNRKGYKTVHLEDIKYVTKESRCGKFYGYRISFEGKKADLWIETNHK